jgi:hypothetical protein
MPGEDPLEFRGGPVIPNFTADIPKVEQGIVIHGGKAYRFLKTMAAILKAPLHKVEHPQVVPGFGVIVIPHQGAIVLFFG